MSSKERKALGRGFSALLKPIEEIQSEANGLATGKKEEPTGGPIQVEIARIRLNPKQPRTYFNEEALQDLAQSIRAKGVIQPILLRRIQEGEEEHLELIAGERRLRASKLAGFDFIPAFIREVKDRDLLEIALIENIQRDDLNPMEEALAYSNLLKEHGYTQDDLAKRVGKNRSTIANCLRLLQLGPDFQENVIKGELSPGHARCILALDEEGKQVLLRDKILKEGLSVREAEQWVKKIQNPAPEAKPEKQDSQTRQNQERLQNLFATKVHIKTNGEKGKIEIDFFNDADFNRIFALLMQLQK